MNEQVLYPVITDDVLTNPHMGFVEAPGLSSAANGIRTVHGESVPPYRLAGSVDTFNHPDARIAFVGVRWRDLERQEGCREWNLLEQKLEAARERGCVSVVRLSPYALGEDDVPAWFRAETPEHPEFPFWQVDPHGSRYIACWTDFIAAFAARFDGHPLISSVDLAMVGAWGEGGGTEFLEEEEIRCLAAAYLNHFHKTPVTALLHDPTSLRVIRAFGKPVGFRVDCLGDMGGFHGESWSHMRDFYPQNIVNFGMKDAWKTSPVLFEACWHMEDWFRHGWDISYIIDESLRWHISSYNNKATTVPEPWKAEVERWLRRMGYRFELRRLACPGQINAGGEWPIETTWVNTGVAPLYHRYPLVFRLGDVRLASAADVTTWMPEEDVVVFDRLIVPFELEPGEHVLSVGILTGIVPPGALMLPLTGRDEDGFYPIGKVVVV